MSLHDPESSGPVQLGIFNATSIEQVERLDGAAKSWQAWWATPEDTGEDCIGGQR